MRSEKGKFSPTMRSCMYYAREHGNVLVRYPGGFWAKRDWKPHEHSFGTNTVEALEVRGAGTYTQWQKRKDGQSSFPVEFTLNTQDTSAGRGDNNDTLHGQAS